MKRILITGASSGLGAELARVYARPGVELFLIARRQDKLEAVGMACRAQGAQVRTFILDVRDYEAMKITLTRLDEEAPLDLVVANAGISGGSSGLGPSGSYEQDSTIFDVNVNGVLNTLHPVLARMVERRAGQIAIISSLAGFLAVPGAPAYAASKAAVRFYGEALAIKLRPHNVFVTVVCPGFVRSEMTDANDFKMPFMMDTRKAANYIAKGITIRKACICFPFPAVMTLSIVRMLPSAVKNYIYTLLPEKKRLP